MSTFLTYQVIISIFSVVFIFYGYGSNAGLSFLLGALTTFANLCLHAWSWKRIFSKKTVALAVGVIVFKYAILVMIIYLAVRDQRVLVGWFGGGFATLLPATLLFAWNRYWWSTRR